MSLEYETPCIQSCLIPVVWARGGHFEWLKRTALVSGFYISGIRELMDGVEVKTSVCVFVVKAMPSLQKSTLNHHVEADMVCSPRWGAVLESTSGYLSGVVLTSIPQPCDLNDEETGRVFSRRPRPIQTDEARYSDLACQMRVLCLLSGASAHVSCGDISRPAALEQ